LPLTRFFQVSIASKNESELYSLRSNSLTGSQKYQVKDIKRLITISVKDGLPLNIKYADYQVELEFTEWLRYQPAIKGTDNDYIRTSLKFTLDAANNWNSTKALEFKGVPVYGTYRPAGTALLGALTSMLGGPEVKSGDLDVDFSLISSKLNFKLLEMK